MNFNKKENKSHNVLSLLKKISYKKNDNKQNEILNDLIPIPLEFKYSFTLNSSDNKQQSEKLDNPFKINNIEIIKKDNNDIENNDEKKNEINWQIEKIDITKINILYKKRKHIYKNYTKSKNNKKEEINNNDPFLAMKTLFDNKKDIILKREHKNNKNEFLEKKRNLNLIKSQGLKELYNSNKISLWESDNEEDDNIVNEDKQNKLLQSQIDFISKAKEHFIDKKVKEKSEYDIDLDKGKVKKVHKKNNKRFKHKNYFQNISNKKLKNV